MHTKLKPKMCRAEIHECLCDIKENDNAGASDGFIPTCPTAIYKCRSSNHLCLCKEKTNNGKYVQKHSIFFEL